ncbi:hypothetical protein P879_04093 [Paragonimus westermani]|uniref:Ankyrin repeat domain-containing protein 26 n=1 Tax=Paragonimus westermani TaxID=34504 RepID=A0A8T0DJB6_9TREM|nr:hypothetical protein P879_04093 [Paragonimus westermani]
MKAIQSKSYECVDLLIVYKADLNVVDKNGDTAIHQAVRGGSVVLTERILNAGISIDLPNKYLLTPLHLAVNTGNVAMVAFLLEHQAKVDCVDVNKRSALMFGCIIGSLPIVELLIQNGANIRLKDNEGFTALKYAQLYHHTECKMAVLDARKHSSSSRAGVCSPTDHSQGSTDEDVPNRRRTKKTPGKTSSNKPTSVPIDKAHISVPKIFIENDETRYQPIGSETDEGGGSSAVDQFVGELGVINLTLAQRKRSPSETNHSHGVNGDGTENTPSVICGSRHSPDGGLATTPSPPIPVLSVSSIASTTAPRVSLSQCVVSSGDAQINNVHRSESAVDRREETVTNFQNSADRRVQNTLVPKIHMNLPFDRIDSLTKYSPVDRVLKLDEDSWNSDTDTEGKNKMATVEARIGQKIREHARISFLSQSTGRSSASNHTASPVAGSPSADNIAEKNASGWDTEEDNKSVSSKSRPGSRELEGSPMVHSDWDSKSPSARTQNADQFNEFTLPQESQLGTTNFRIYDQHMESSSAFYGPFRKAVEWDSSEDSLSVESNEDSCDEEMGEVEGRIPKEEISCAMKPGTMTSGQLDTLGDKGPGFGFADNCGVELGPQSLPEISKVLEDENSVKQGCKEMQGASVKDHVVVSLKSAASEEDESEQLNLSPILEVDEEVGIGGHDKLWSGIAVHLQSDVVQKDPTVVLSSGNLSPYHCAIVDQKDVSQEYSSSEDDVFTSGINKEKQFGKGDIITMHEELRPFGGKRDGSTALVPLVTDLQAPDQIISSTLNFSTLNGVPSMPDLPRVRDTRPRRVPPRRKAYMITEQNKEPFAEFVGGCTEQVEEKKTDGYLFAEDTNQNEPGEDEFAETTNDLHMTLEDFLTADEKVSMHSTDSDLVDFAGIDLENFDDGRVGISSDGTGRRVTEISPKLVPRTSRSIKRGNEEPHVDATIENTESVTLASSADLIPDPSKTGRLNKKAPQGPSSRDAIQSMFPSVVNGSQQSVDLSCSSFAHNKPLENTLSDGRAPETLNELTRKLLPGHSQSIDGPVEDTGMCSLENLQSKLIAALRALQLEHKSHEELEEARDAAESKLRSLTLKLAGIRTAGEVDDTFGDLLNSTDINQLTLLRNEIAQSKLEKQKLESRAEIIHLNEQLQAVNEEKKKADILLQEALSEIQRYKLDVARVDQLKTELRDIRQTLEQERASWGSEISQLKQEFYTVQQTTHMNITNQEYSKQNLFSRKKHGGPGHSTVASSPEETLIRAEQTEKSNFGCQYPVCEDVGTDVQSLADIGELQTIAGGQTGDGELVSGKYPLISLSKRVFEWDKLISEHDRLQDLLKAAEERLSNVQEADQLLFEKLILVVSGKDDDPRLTARMSQLPQSEQRRLHACFSLLHKSQELKRTSPTGVQEVPENPEVLKLNQSTLEEFMKLLTSTEERVNQLHSIIETSKQSHEAEVKQLREQLTVSEAHVAELKVALETKEQKTTTDPVLPRRTCQQITQTNMDEAGDLNSLDLTNHVIGDLRSRLERAEQKVENLSRTNSGNLSSEHSAKHEESTNKVHTVEKNEIHYSRPSTPICGEVLELRQRLTELQVDHDRLVKENKRLTAKADRAKGYSEKRKQNTCYHNPVYSTAPPIPICPAFPSGLANTIMSPLNLGFSNCLCIPQTPWNPTHCIMSRCILNHDVCDKQENAPPQKSIRQCSAPHPSCERPNNRPFRNTLSKTNYQSSWSLDQDEPELEDNSQLVGLHCLNDNKPFMKNQASEGICEDLLEKLRPEIDRSITRHIEASGSLLS